MTDWQKVVCKILMHPNPDLRELAKIAGCDPSTFYDTADFRNADLSEQDITGLDLSRAKLPRSFAKTERFLDEEPNSNEDEVAKITLSINSSIHFKLKTLNPRQLSPHIDALMRSFFRTYERNKQQLETFSSVELEEKVLALISSPKPETHTVSYRIGRRTRKRLDAFARDVGHGVAESARISIYYPLVYDTVRGISLYDNQSTAEET